MKRVQKIIFASVAFIMMASSCEQPEGFDARLVRDDLPYPVVIPNIVSIEADGATGIEINNEQKTISVILTEQADIRNVNIKNCIFALSPKDSSLFADRKIKSEPSITGCHDLSEPLISKVTTYQSYEWTVSARQPIERYFTIKGQIGASSIDDVNHRVIVYVSDRTSLKNIEVLSCKLGPEDITTYSTDPLSIKDFSDGVSIELSTTHDVTEIWDIFVETMEFHVAVTKINPWTKEAYISASGIAGEDNGLRYRISGETDWKEVDKSCISTEGGSFTGHLEGLAPDTDYECIAFSGEQESEIMPFHTDKASQMPNNSLDIISKVTGKDYYKWYDPSNPACSKIWWASGNGEGPDGIDGTASLGVILTVPDSDAADGAWSACAQSSQLAGILACGNIFTGQFTEIIGGTAGAVCYGRPWTTRPKALVLSYKYKGGAVDCVDDYPVDDVVKLGDKDRCQICISVGDWDYHKYGGNPESPVRVSTARNERSTLFNSSNEGIIGYGNFVTNESVDEWTELRIPLEYRSIDRMPTHIMVICATNYRGDYMTGCSSAKLWVDNFRLEY